MKRLRSLATFIAALAITTLGLVAPTALPASAITCQAGFVPNESGTACIAPVVAPVVTPPATTAPQTAGTGTFNCNGAQIPVGSYCPPATTPPQTADTGTFNCNEAQIPVCS